MQAGSHPADYGIIFLSSAVVFGPLHIHFHLASRKQHHVDVLCHTAVLMTPSALSQPPILLIHVVKQLVPVQPDIHSVATRWAALQNMPQLCRLLQAARTVSIASACSCTHTVSCSLY